MDKRPIGVFDSGVGGITVLKEIRKLLPNENIIYYGDTARVPYGTRPKKEIFKLSMNAVNFLIKKDIKLLVIACNTATAVVYDYLTEKLDIPVIGVIDPGVSAVMNHKDLKRVGLIATEATVDSKAYENRLKILSPDLLVQSKACPMLVSIVEEGWHEEEIARFSIEKYLKEFKDKNIDALIMACTHFPVLREGFSNYLGKDTLIIDPAEETAISTKQVLEDKNMSNLQGDGNIEFFVTGNKERFEKTAKHILNIMKIDVLQVED